MDRTAEFIGIDGIARCGCSEYADLGRWNAKVAAGGAEAREGGDDEGYGAGGDGLSCGGASGELGVVEGDGSAVLEDCREDTRCGWSKVGD